MNWTDLLATRSRRSKAPEIREFLTLPPQIDAAPGLAAARQTECVAFVPGRACFADTVNGNTLRLSFSGADVEAMIDVAMPRHGRPTRRAL